jgi:uncharacterized protein with PQ loop repeat
MTKMNLFFNDTLTFKPWGNFSTKSKFAISIAFIIFVIIESSFLFWQFQKIVSNKSAKDVSLPAFVILLLSNIVWLVYSLILGSWGILLSGILYIVGTSMVIGAHIYYGEE